MPVIADHLRTTGAALLALAERCEKATGPDRELDFLIWAHQLGYEPEWQGNCLVVGIEGVVGWIDPGQHSRNFHTNRETIGPASIPAYTASIDAAMTLVPGDIGGDNGDYWRPHIERTHRGTWAATLSPPWNSERNTTVFKTRGDPATAPLALTAACLRARDSDSRALREDPRSGAEAEARQSGAEGNRPTSTGGHP